MSPLLINRDRLLHRLDELAEIGAIDGDELWTMSEKMWKVYCDRLTAP
ncbi:hypothetical protein [Halomicronema sp. CCY15110]|nr:hypothetical protein [Halomicronema sp. CCY15110]